MRNSQSRIIFMILNTSFLVLAAFLCILPVINILAVSLSDKASTAAGMVTFWPKGFNISSYEYIIQNRLYTSSFLISLKRLALGVPINMAFTILVAYPLSREDKDFKTRKVYVYFFYFTILFSGGLIPWYMVIKYTGLMYTIWALVIPGALPVFNAILLLNFFRQLPKELEESAFIDGASFMTTLVRIILPLSKPALATIMVFTIVGHWNSWFDGIILSRSKEDYPLQSYLQTVIVGMNNLQHITEKDAQLLQVINNRSVKAAQLFVALIPIMAVYPLLQKYFTKGLVLGSVKG